MANRRFIDFPVATTVGANDIILIWQDGLNKQTTKATILSGLPEDLEDLADVNISGLTNGQILRYDSTTGKWINTDQANLDLSDLNDVSIVSPSNGQVLVYNSSTSKWENSSAGFVPYTGAVTTVDLGAQQLKAGQTTLATNGSTPTLTVNHTSGSGIGVNITKGGNNEGLKVNKTSGSGNAATIVGTLEATTLVKTGGTSSQFLKADGSVDSTAYVPTSREVIAGAGLAGGGALTSNVTLSHADTSSQASVDNSNGNVIQDITLDTYGHITALGSTNLDSRYYTESEIDATLANYQLLSAKGQPNGYAGLDSNGKVPLAQINDALIGNVNFQGLWNAATNTPTLANPPAAGTKGYYYIVSTAGTFAGISFEVGDWIISNGSAWGKVDNTDAVSSVFGRTGNVTAANGDYNTSQVTESGNLYFTNARAIASVLTGYSSSAGTISAADTILSAIQKLNGNIGALVTGVSSVNGLTGAVTLTTTNIGEGTNLYFTNARARAALSFVAGSGAYNSTTGVITIPTNNNQITNGAGYITGNQTITLSGVVTGSGTTAITTAIANGAITNAMLANSSFFIGTTSIGLGRASAAQTLAGVSIDGNAATANTWTTARTITIGNTGKSVNGSANVAWSLAEIGAYAATNPSAFIALTALSGTAPIQYNNTTGAISITQASGSTNGFLSSTDWNTFNNKTSNVGTVTSVAALTLGTSGTDLSSSVANGTTTPVITLNVPTASAANRGALSAADWTTFNNKQNALTNPVTGTGTTNFLPKFTGGSTIGNSAIQDDGSSVLIGRETFITGTTAYFQVGNATGATGKFQIESTSGAAIIGTRDDSSILFRTNLTTKLTLNSAGNLGLGVTPSAWNTAYKAFQFGTTGAIFGESGDAANYFTTNTFVDSVGFKYITSDWALGYFQENGVHSWRTAPSGTAGNAISFTQAMTLFATGNLLVGSGSDNGARLQTSTTTTGNSVGALFANPNQAGTADSVSVNFGLGRTADSFLRSDAIITFGKEQQWTGTPSTVDGYLAFSTVLNETAAERMRITSAGDVLIGATAGIASTRRELVIRGANGSLLSLGNNTTADRFQIVSDSGENALLNNKANTPMIFYTNNVERSRIFAGGNAHIGPTPSSDNGARLQVSGTASVSGVGYFGGSASLVTSTGILTTSANLQMFIGSAASNATDKMADVILANNNSFTTGTIGRLIGVNTAVTTADKRIAQIAFGLDGAINSGAIGFATLSAGTFATRLTIASTGAATFSSSVTAGGNIISPTYFFRAINPATESGIETTIVATGNGENVRAGIFATNNYAANVSTSLIFKTNDSSGGAAERMRITSGGNVLIGLAGNNGGILRAKDLTNRYAIAFEKFNSTLTLGGFFQNSGSSGEMILVDTNGNQNVLISSSGNSYWNAPSARFSIGTTVNTSDLFRVAGNTFTNTIMTFNPENDNRSGVEWRLGAASIASITPNRRLRVSVGGVEYYIGAVEV